MTNLANNVGSSCLFVLSKLLEVCVSQVDVLDHHFLSLAFDNVADVVGVFGEDKNAGSDEFGDGSVYGEAETCYAGPEGFRVFGPVLVEEVCCGGVRV